MAYTKEEFRFLIEQGAFKWTEPEPKPEEETVEGLMSRVSGSLEEIKLMYSTVAGAYDDLGVELAELEDEMKILSALIEDLANNF